MITSSSSRGASTVSIIVTAGLAVLMVAFAGLSIWAYMNYLDQKNNVDAKISRAVATAEKEQADKLETDFIEREKEPLKSFAGPSDYGTLGFKYPKTWSVYIAKDGSNDKGYEAYLNPGTVPTVAASASRYSLRVMITNEQYEDVLDEYQEEVKDGKLKTSAVKANGDKNDGTRLDGNFTKDIRGAAVVFKIRDKTATLRTDADTFKPDFETLIKTITFDE